jgi:hypothetical protein
MPAFGPAARVITALKIRIGLKLWLVSGTG